MLKGRKILSLPVVTQEDNKPIGEIKDIIYDPEKNQIVGYLVDIGGWLREGKGFLHVDLLKREEDCLVIKDESVIKKISKMDHVREAIDKDIRGLKVELEDGRCIGVIQDVLVDDKTGEITGYEISDGVIQDLLDGRSTISNEGLNILADRVVTVSNLVTKSDVDIKSDMDTSIS